MTVISLKSHRQLTVGITAPTHSICDECYSVFLRVLMFFCLFLHYISIRTSISKSVMSDLLQLLLPLITTSQPTTVFIRTINSFSVSVILKYNCAHVLSYFVCSKARRLLCALPSRQAASTFYIYCHLQFLVHHLCTTVRLRSNYPTFSL